MSTYISRGSESDKGGRDTDDLPAACRVFERNKLACDGLPASWQKCPWTCAGYAMSHSQLWRYASIHIFVYVQRCRKIYEHLHTHSLWELFSCRWRACGREHKISYTILYKQLYETFYNILYMKYYVRHYIKHYIAYYVTYYRNKYIK